MTRSEAQALIDTAHAVTYQLADGSHHLGVLASSFGRKLDWIDARNLGFKVADGRMVSVGRLIGREAKIILV